MYLKKLNIGDKVRLTNQDYPEYEQLKNKDLTISHIAYNQNDHIGYDSSISPQALIDCKEINFSLYEYEFRVVKRNKEIEN